MKTLACAACFALVASTSHAADAHGGFATYGQGAASCGQHIRFVQTQSALELVDVAWVLGFLTSYNVYGWQGNDVGNHADGDAVRQWLNNYCATHPLDDVADAAQELVIEFRKRPHASN